MKSKKVEKSNPDENNYGISCMGKKIFEYVAKGQSRKEIAEHLNMSIHTVDKHIEEVYRKLGVHKEAEAIAKLMSEHIVSYDPYQSYSHFGTKIKN